MITLVKVVYEVILLWLSHYPQLPCNVCLWNWLFGGKYSWVDVAPGCTS